MLDLACCNGYTECVETLLLQGSTILVHDNITRRTPLHAAGNFVTFFMKKKASIPDSVAVHLSLHCLKKYGRRKPLVKSV